MECQDGVVVKSTDPLELDFLDLNPILTLKMYLSKQMAKKFIY